jgi:hypothetical protein
MDKYNWISKFGVFKQNNSEIVFEGGVSKSDDNNLQYSKMGMYISDQIFSEGSITATFKFSEISNNFPILCGIIFTSDTLAESFIAVGFNILPKSDSSFSIFSLDPNATGNKWNFFAHIGDKNDILPNVEYKLKILLAGSRLDFLVNNVNIISYNFPFLIPRKQVGLWCQSSGKIIIKDYIVNEEKGKTFVIMEFSQKYNDLYHEVISPICIKNNIEPIRADESKTTGLILNDIIKRIYEAKFIIAEITPKNPNVYFEIGFAIAIQKPVIFIADKNNIEGLPFDISGFRVLFYENTIPGKSKIEEELSKHIESILSE